MIKINDTNLAVLVDGAGDNEIAFINATEGHFKNMLRYKNGSVALLVYCHEDTTVKFKRTKLFRKG